MFRKYIINRKLRKILISTHFCPQLKNFPFTFLKEDSRRFEMKVVNSSKNSNISPGLLLFYSKPKNVPVSVVIRNICIISRYLLECSGSTFYNEFITGTRDLNSPRPPNSKVPPDPQKFWYVAEVDKMTKVLDDGRENG